MRNALKPLAVIYRQALRDELVAVNPCRGRELDRPTGKRERIATPREAEELVAALRADDRALGCALYAGLRQGEIMALDWSDIDLDARLIRLRRGFDRRDRDH